MNRMNVAVIGLGTIGGGVCLMLSKYQKEDVKLYAICDKRVEILENLDLNVKKYQDYRDVLIDKDIDLIVEVMGGEHPAFEVIKEALERGISVVSANKEVVAKHYEELSEILKKSSARFLFEASVGGVVPIVNAIYNYQRANKIERIEGILNGSTNFLLTLMQKDGVSYSCAVEEAKRRGFLEQDPRSDLRGLDMMRKIVILSNIAYNTCLDIDDVYSYSLENVTDKFIEELKINDLMLKYMAESTIKDGKVSIRIEPVCVSSNSLYASIIYERNYVAFIGEEQEKVEMMGLGAGRFPTATAIISDIMQIASEAPKLDLEIKEKLKINNNELVDRYIIDGKIDDSLVSHKLGSLLVTKEISWKELQNNLDKIKFYARIK